jgi:hypothetical protein
MTTISDYDQDRHRFDDRADDVFDRVFDRV